MTPLARSANTLQFAFIEQDSRAKIIRLEIYNRKTKYLLQTTRETSLFELKLQFLTRSNSQKIWPQNAQTKHQPDLEVRLGEVCKCYNFQILQYTKIKNTNDIYLLLSPLFN